MNTARDQYLEHLALRRGAGSCWWNAVILTASSPRQADSYRQEIELRKEQGSRGCRGLHLDDAAQDAIPRRAVLLGAHRGGFLIADDHLLLGIPVNGPPAEAKRHIAEVAYDGCAMAHFQIAERLVARLHAIDPVALVGVEHLVFHGQIGR